MLQFSTILDLEENVLWKDAIDLLRQWDESLNLFQGGWESNPGDIVEKEGLLTVRRRCGKKRLQVLANFPKRQIAIRQENEDEEAPTQPNDVAPAQYLTCLLLQHGYVKDDHGLPIRDAPDTISDNNIDILRRFLKKTYRLPMVYIARNSRGELPVNHITLSYRLAGAAHIYIENEPEKCVKCRKLLHESGEEYGAVRIYYPSDLKRKRFLYRSFTGDQRARTEKVIQSVCQYWELRQLKTLYDWKDENGIALEQRLQAEIQNLLSEKQARKKAENEADLAYEIFGADIKNLETKIKELNKTIDILQAENHGLKAKLNSMDSIPVILQGKERDFYQGEIRDILLDTLNASLDNIEKGSRRYDVISDILKSNQYEHLNEKRKQRTKVLLKGFKVLNDVIKRGLIEMGFQIREEGKHYKIQYKDDSRYIVTLSKTPSDTRAGNNCAAVINKVML